MGTARRLRWLSRAGISAVAIATTAAQLTAQARATQAAPKATQVASVEGITEYTLPNGMRFLLFPDQSKPTVTVNITYLVGSRHEGYGEAGMAHLLEHMLFKGTPKYPDVSKAQAQHGARRNGSTWYDRTNYYETMPAADTNLTWALDFEAERMLKSNVTKKDLESEYSVVRNEFENRENSPQGVTFERMMAAAFRWQAYGRTPIGNKIDLEQVPIDRLQTFYKKYYQPDNSILVVAGKFDPAKAIAAIEDKFGRIPKPVRTLDKGNILYPTYTQEPTQDGEKLVTVRRVGDVQLIISGFHVPAASHPDYAVVEVLASVLGDNPSGRLYKALVDPKIAAGAQSFTEPLRERSVLMLAANLRMDQNLDSARQVMDKVAEDARTKPFTAEEVNRAKTNYQKNFDLTMNNSEFVALDLSEWMARGDWRLMFLLRDRVEAVTPADVQRVAAAYMKRDNMTTAMFIPTKSPDRADIPAAPNIATVVASYKGRAVVQAGEAFDASPKNIDARTKRSALANGMQVQLLPKSTRGANVVGQILLRWGTEQALMNKGQVPSYVGTMLNRGTTSLTRQQVQDSLDKLKAQVNIGGSVASASVFIQTTRPNLMPTLDLVAQMLKSPRFDAEEFEKLKKERLASIEQAKSQPTFVAQVALNKKLNPRAKGHPQYAADADEIIADLNAATLDDVKSFYQTFYGANHGDVVLIGDFDENEVKAALTKHFGSWNSPQQYVRIARAPTPTDSTFISIETPDKANAFFMVGQNFDMRDDDPDYPAMLFGNFLFGGGSTSRLWTRIREKEGLSYGVGAGAGVPNVDRAASWTMNAIYAPQNVERLQRAFREELDRLLKDGLTAQEINALRPGYLQGRSQSRANDGELVSLLMARRFSGRTMAYDEDLEKKIAALTPDEINAVLRKYLDPKKMVIVRAGDFAKNPPAKATP